MRTHQLADLTAAVRGAEPASSLPSFAAFLAKGFNREPSKPYLTWYDDGTGERIELSYATFANWVWKSANYLRDGLDVQPGDEVGVLLRTHWQTVAIWYAGWAAGAVVVPLTLDTLAGASPVAVFAQEDTLPTVVAAGIAPGAVVGLALRPMAGRLTAAYAGVEDYAVEVPGYGDHFTPGAPGSSALPGRSVAQVLGGAAAAAAVLALQSGDRVLCTADVVDADAFVGTALAVFQAGAGLVLSPRPDEGRLDRRCTDELITVRIVGAAGS